MPSVSRTKRLSIIDKLEPYSVLVSVLPRVPELAQGKVNICAFCEVSITDLLGCGALQANK